MKNILGASLCVALTACLPSAKKQEANEQSTAPINAKAASTLASSELSIRIAKATKEFTIDVPQGSKVDVKPGGTFVEKGEAFSIGIAVSDAATIAAERKAVTSKNEKVIDTNTPTLLVFHSDLLGTPMYGFIASATVEKSVLTCGSTAFGSYPFSKEDVDSMVRSCSSLRGGRRSR